jgi:predicted nucleotidyltransferase
MRISLQQQQAIKRLILEMAGANAITTVFGSRIDDDQRGGDLDLMVELPHAADNPAWFAAKLSAKISRLVGGRRVDVILLAPNLKTLPIHEHAKSTGKQL